MLIFDYIKGLINLIPKYKNHIIVFILIAFGLSTRLYKISYFTEFLGDQGRDAFDVLILWGQKTIPFVGPPSSLGIRQGPFYYWFITPFLLIDIHNPIWPAVAMVLVEIIGYLFLFILTKSILSQEAAIFTLLICVVSPVLVRADRNFWNPTMLPAFSILTVLSLYKIIKDGKYQYSITAGICAILALQLHFSAFHLILAVVFLWFILIAGKNTDRKLWFKYGAITSIILIFISGPYIYYQFSHSYVDLIKLFSLIQSGQTGLLQFRNTIFHTQNAIVYLYKIAIPFDIPPAFLWLVFSGSVIYVIYQRKFFTLTITVWIISALLVSARFMKMDNMHYVVSLWPLFMVINMTFIDYLFKSRKYLWLVFAPVIIINISRIIHAAPTADIFRTKQMVNIMEERSGGKPYSFTLINSKSFSDYHYRYFQSINKFSPVDIRDDYERLYLVCDSFNCPSREVISAEKKIPVICFDKVCGLNYPDLDMGKWYLTDSVNVGSGIVYEFLKK